MYSVCYLVISCWFILLCVNKLTHCVHAIMQIVRWRDVRRTKPTDPEDLIVASHVNLLPTEDTLTISDLVPGSQYQVRSLSSLPCGQRNCV